MSKTKQHRKPCATCPFSRKVESGALGGSPATTFVGQCRGPFWIPCHESRDYREKGSEFGQEAECAGSAIFRANVGVAGLMPDALLHLEQDTEKVFASWAEFLAHHTGESNEACEEFLGTYSPEYLFQIELSKQEARILETKGN